jgi:hypothetical protein
MKIPSAMLPRNHGGLIPAFSTIGARRWRSLRMYAAKASPANLLGSTPRAATSVDLRIW